MALFERQREHLKFPFLKQMSDLSSHMEKLSCRVHCGITHCVSSNGNTILGHLKLGRYSGLSLPPGQSGNPSHPKDCGMQIEALLRHLHILGSSHASISSLQSPQWSIPSQIYLIGRHLSLFAHWNSVFKQVTFICLSSLLSLQLGILSPTQALGIQRMESLH